MLHKILVTIAAWYKFTEFDINTILYQAIYKKDRKISFSIKAVFVMINLGSKISKSTS